MDFRKKVTDGLTDGLTDGQTILWRSKDASKICIFNALIHDKKLIIKLWAISYHRFMKKSPFCHEFFEIIKDYMIFCIDLCKFSASIYDTK